MKRISLIAALLALLFSGTARAVTADGWCSCVATNSSGGTVILSANDQGDKGRLSLCLQNVSVTAADYVACSIGNTTTITMTSGIILPAQSSTSAILVPPYCVPVVQTPGKTSPLAPSGAVNCKAAAGTPTVCACVE
jgi:hypothetical protein